MKLDRIDICVGIIGIVILAMLCQPESGVHRRSAGGLDDAVATDSTGEAYTNVQRPEWGKMLEAYEWSAKEIYELTQRVHAGTTNVGFGTNFAMFASSNGVLTIWWSLETEEKRHRLEKGKE